MPSGIVYVYASRNYVCSHENIYLVRLETVHHVVSLLLGEVRMHLVAVYSHAFQVAGDVFHFQLRTRENYHSRKFVALEEMLQYGVFLRFVAYISRLLNLVGGLAHREFYGYWALQQSPCNHR